MNNPQVLEKQLLHMELSKGTNERSRPETADAATTLTRVENLIQDQTGAWVKRQGLSQLGSAIVKPQRALRTKGGLAVVTANADFYQYSEAYSAFNRIRQSVLGNSVPEVTVDGADFIASSGSNASYNIMAAASSSKFHAVCSLSGVSQGNDQQPVITVYDRESSAVVVSYQPATICNTVQPPVNVRMAFVADRYLVVFCNNRVVSVDLGGAFPPGETALKFQSVAYVAGFDLVFDTGPFDIAVSDTRAFVSCKTTGGVCKVVAVDGATNAVAESFNTTSVAFLCFCPFASDLWYLDGVSLGSKDASNLAVDVQPLFASGYGTGAVAFYVTRAGVPYVICGSSPAFGTTTAPRLTVYVGEANDTTTGASLQATLDGWSVVSHPFECDDDTQVYIHLCKATGTELAPHVVANLTYPGVAVNNTSYYHVIPLSATLDPYTGLTVTGAAAYRPFTTDSAKRKLSLVVPVRTTARGAGFAFFDLHGNAHAGKECVVFGGNSYISGGAQGMYDGLRVTEAGFVDVPLINASASATAGVIPSGIYKYLAVYRSTDTRSSGSFSRVSSIASVTAPGAKKTSISILPCQLTRRYDVATSDISSQSELVIVDLYRTLVGGTQYYLCASTQLGTVTGLSTQFMGLSAGRFLCLDNMTDAVLATQPLLYRQPGTPNAAVDRYPAPPSNLLVTHKDRLFTADPYGDRVYYSSFAVDGECAWYNPAFSFLVHGGAGPITALASMDGRLFVFKNDCVFVVDGDGPGESGPTGNEFSPPQRLATEYGCIDHRSIVITTDGIVYRSRRGIEILTRSLQVKWIGEAVQVTCRTYPGTRSAVLDSFGRVRIILSSDDTPGSTGGFGVELVFDPSNGSWSTQYHTVPGNGTYAASLQDSCVADINGLGNVVVYTDPVNGVYYGNENISTDMGYYAPFTMETGWLKLGQQTRARFTRLLALLKKHAGSNHALTLSVAFNYEDTYTQTHTWEPGTINALTIEELEMQLARQEVMAVRLKLSDAPPADEATYPRGAGKGAAILGITLEVAAKTGAPKGAPGQRA